MKRSSGADKKEDKNSKPVKEPDKKIRSPPKTDEEILQQCRGDENKEKFLKLYDKGDISGYPSHSEADFALCLLMGLYTQDEKQIDRLFGKGALFRDEWERKSKYTIRNAIDKHDEGYNPEKKGKKKSDENKPEKILVPFDVVADQILKDNPIFSMRDNKQIYLYKGGVYKNEGTEAILDTEIRNVHNHFFVEHWNIANPGFPLSHLPKATAKYVTEVLAYIRAYTHITRDSIEGYQANILTSRTAFLTSIHGKLKTTDQRLKLSVRSQLFTIKTRNARKLTISLKEVAEADINLRCEIAGYCLTTDCSFQKAFMLDGVGSNGKSVFLALLESLIGGENTSAESLQKLEIDKYRTAKLYGKRVNICGDIPDSKMQKSENFKKLTSGLDLMDGENKYQHSFVFRSTAKLVFSANILPEGKKDKAYYRRWILIQFPNNFEGGTKTGIYCQNCRTLRSCQAFLILLSMG